MPHKTLDEPIMSDKTLLVSVEDLINIAMGPTEKNTVDFKTIQMVLHILARQLRMLERQVEIRIGEMPLVQEGKVKKGKAEKGDKNKAERPEKGEKATEKAEKASEKGEKGSEKGEKASEKGDKDSEKKGKGSEKGEKASEKGEKAKGKEGKAGGKEKGMEEKEKEKAETARGKGKGKDDKAGKKEKEAEQYEKETVEKDKKGKKGQKEKVQVPSGTSIAVSEKDQVLVVEKVPAPRGDGRTRVGSIEVVTQSQFALLEAAVHELQKKAGPLPPLVMPDNEKLRSDLVKGNASLTDTMQAMQVNARVQAAEHVIGRLAGLLTQLAAAGALPEDIVGKIHEATEVKFDLPSEVPAKKSEASGGTPRSHGSPSRKSVAIEPMSKASKPEMSAARPSVMSAARPSAAGGPRPSQAPPSNVTHKDMDDSLRSLREDLMKNVSQMTAKSTAVADSAIATAKSLSERMDVALKLNLRINTLHSLVTDYAEQLSGYDAGLTTQLQSFQEQMTQIRSDLRSGLNQLEQVNNNAETAAILELTERYEGLVSELDHTLLEHQDLTTTQNDLGDQLRSLIECVEMLREQKADRDEVLDGLRDKADISRLAGLLTDVEFAKVRAELENRLAVCYNKFHKQDQVWMGAIKDLTIGVEKKAEIMQLLGARDEARDELRALHHRVRQLTLILGEPKAAMLTRKLGRDAFCGLCLVPALMSPREAARGAPHQLPPLQPRLRPARPAAADDHAEEPCMKEWKPPEPPDNRQHVCLRWCGGSHTLLAAVTRDHAPPPPPARPTERYAGYGTDGKLYMLEKELQPCLECNQMISETELKATAPPPSPPGEKEEGAGDQGAKCVTIINKS